MIYEQKFSEKAKEKLKGIAKGFKWNYEKIDYLIACIMFESNANPQAVNKLSGATGLIQFMPRTAESLGTSTDLLYRMTQEQQLDFVKDYLKPYAKKIETLEDMYMSILYPSAIGIDNESSIFRTQVQYRQNCKLDWNNDGKITKAEATRKVREIYEKGIKLCNSGVK